MREWQSQTHVKWYCRYHVVMVPKYRRKSIARRMSTTEMKRKSQSVAKIINWQARSPLQRGLPHTTRYAGST